MLINLRNALMAGKQLPYDAEVEYLESTGTQWIDSGIKPSDDLTSYCTFAVTRTPNQDSPFGCRPTGDDRYWLICTSTNTAIGYGDSRNLGVAVAQDEVVELAFNVVSGNTHSFSLKGATITASGTPNTTANIMLFGRNTLGANVYSRIRMYSLKMVRGGTLVRDYIPVRVGTVGYLYDRVSGKLFGNAGTGDFVVGPDRN